MYEATHTVEVKIGEHTFRTVGSPLDEHFMSAFDKWIALVRALTGVAGSEAADKAADDLDETNKALQTAIDKTKGAV
jgi:hypothetical protein